MNNRSPSTLRKSGRSHGRVMARPFDLADARSYAVWRERKLAAYPHSVQALRVRVKNPLHLSPDEHAHILDACRRANMAFYEFKAAPDGTTREAVRALGRQFGLERLDGNLRADEDRITSLHVRPSEKGNVYIPYTDRPMNWHTDGYYNRPDRQVHAIVMHCESEPASGGENLFLDPEILYILLRDENPDYIRALMQPDAMSIPPNIEDGVEIRPGQGGPVFSVEPASGALHMRYTARTRSIAWKDDRDTRLARGFLAELLKSESDYIFRYRLRAGEGIICNNVLHRREAFTDDPESGRLRMLYRARYHDRIAGTGMEDIPVEGACSG